MGKYPKTFHFSWSKNLQNNDRMLEDDNILVGHPVVCSLKLDGENQGLTHTSCHARSLDSRDHPSRHWVKSLHARIRNLIPVGWKLFGENMYAKHSIFYHSLPTYFFLFMVVDEKDMVLSWADTIEWAELLELHTVPVLYAGPWDIDKVKACDIGHCPMGWGDDQEGYVVRNAETFPIADFHKNAGKSVRKGHVTTDEFWMKNWIPNKLK